MQLADFGFDLPRELIADRPAEPRGSARLLVIPAAGELSDRHIADLPELLRPGDLLVFNDTKVIPARLVGHGEMPLPPYIKRPRGGDARDRADYQTMFAKEEGAVAAPTAGLHFTPALLDRLTARGVDWLTVTLHVGPGTFLPVKTDDPREHRMHAEWGVVTAAVAERINAARGRGGRIVAVGTTSLRLLESAAAETGEVHEFAGETRLFILPGYRFRAIDLLLTNFHLPRSTLMMLVAALAGLDRIKSAYAHAIAEHYRFFSYGDACLIEPAAHLHRDPLSVRLRMPARNRKRSGPSD